MADGWFSAALFTFLKDLSANNTREWFQANKERYEAVAKGPALEFIEAFAPRLSKISKEFVADPRPVGGSMFRTHRDTRFSNDKTPYKTNIAFHFRHRSTRTDVHMPGYYLSIEPGRVEAGCGLWRPDAKTSQMIRQRIADKPAEWNKAAHALPFAKDFELTGDSLKRVPAPFPSDHPLGTDLRRKDFVGLTHLKQKDVTAPDFLERYTALCAAAAPFMKFLCTATGFNY